MTTAAYALYTLAVLISAATWALIGVHLLSAHRSDRKGGDE